MNTKNRTLKLDALFADVEVDLHEEWLRHKKEDIAIALTDMLFQAKLSRADLARKLEWKPSRVTKALSGRENLTIGTLAEIVNAAGYDFDIRLRGRGDARAFQPWEVKVAREYQLELASILLTRIEDIHTEAEIELKKAKAIKATAEALSRAQFRASANAKLYRGFPVSTLVSANDCANQKCASA